jgi:multicomponent Na+:H+ antiporter subunit G
VNQAAAILLTIAAASSWIASVALLRLGSLSRLNAVSFINIAGGGAVTLAVWIVDGMTARSAKTVLIWFVLVLSGAVSSHVTGRAIHLRSGEKR